MTRSSIAVVQLLALLAAGGCNKNLPKPAAPAPEPAEPAAAGDPNTVIELPPLTAKPRPDPQAPADVAAAPADAQRVPSGLASKVIQPGTGARHPGPDDR